MFEREENPLNVSQADIVVGLASYKEADSIAYPTEQASLGLKKYYGDRSSAILNCDNHSPDGTEEAFLGTDTGVPKIFITTPPDTPGKGYNFENMFRKMLELEAKVLVCVDGEGGAKDLWLGIGPHPVGYAVETREGQERKKNGESVGKTKIAVFKVPAGFIRDGKNEIIIRSGKGDTTILGIDVCITGFNLIEGINSELYIHVVVFN